MRAFLGAVQTDADARQVCVDADRAADVKISEGLKAEHALLNGTTHS